MGAIVGRSEAHALRFAVRLCGAGFQSHVITVKHLNAALAFGKYCEQSAQAHLGNRLGNPDADAIHEALKDRREGLTRTEIRNLFSRKLVGERIDRAREALMKARLIRVEIEQSNGRPAERWAAMEPTRDVSA